MTEEACPAFRRQHPRSLQKGRIVTDVLRVAAREFRHPMLLIILVEAHDLLLHVSTLGAAQDVSIFSAIANNFMTVFQFRPVPGVLSAFSSRGSDSFDRAMPSGK